jgi:MFS transporter, PAT family, beta-lactamase induction signal transducer AmpG
MNLKAFFRDFFSKKMLIIFFLGFSSGLPFLLTSGTLKIWLARENVDISTIGYFSWIGLSYSLKFLWAPFLDRFSFFGLGRRRSWMFLSQICIMIGIAVLGSFEPQVSLQNMVIASILIAFFSATQDIAIDSFRREYLSEIEIGMGSSITQYGGRFAMLVSGGLGVGLVGSGALNLTWHELYYILAGFMAIGLIVTFIVPEPAVNQAEQPRTMRDAVLEPLKEFLTRDKAVIILLFVMLFKFGDAMSGAMLTPYYVQMGYTNEDIGLIAKSFGLASALVGLFIGGVVIYSIGVLRSLWIFGVCQALSTAGFALITWTGPEKWALAATVFFEDISSGMGSAAFVTYLATTTNKKYTATQYAILSSIATLGRNFFSGFSGDLVKVLGWAPFFITCGLLAIPGMIMLFIVSRQIKASLDRR